MAVLFYHDNEAHGPVHLSEGKVAGEPTPARHYHHAGHFLEVDGPAHVVAHDVAEIQKLPGYRLANAIELNEHHASKRKATHLTERKR